MGAAGRPYRSHPGHDRSGQPRPQILLTAANSDTVTAQVRTGAADLGFIEGPARPKGRSLRAIWARGSLPPARAARDLLDHVTAVPPVTAS